MIQIVDQLKLTQSLPLDAKYKIQTISDLDTIDHAYIGMLFFVQDQMSLFIVETLKDGFLVYATNQYVSTQPSGTEYVDWERFSNIFADTYQKVGASQIAIVSDQTDLAVLDNDYVKIVFDEETKTAFYRKDGTYPTNSGVVPVYGTTDQFWVPEYYRTPVDPLVIGQRSIPNTDGFFNASMFKVISSQGSNVPIFSFGTDTPKVNGFQMVNIDYNNESHVPEFWVRGNVLSTDWTCEASATWRSIITGEHTKQIGMGINNYTTGGNPSLFWTGDSDFRQDAVLFWVANNYKFNQQNNFGLSLKDAVMPFQVIGSGDIKVKGTVYTGSLNFSNDLTVSHQASTYIFTGGNGITLTLPDPNQLDVWGAKEYENMEITIINLGTDSLTLSRNIVLDASTPLNILNAQYPDNIIRIKCIAGNWIKVG